MLKHTTVNAIAVENLAVIASTEDFIRAQDIIRKQARVPVLQHQSARVIQKFFGEQSR
ncbi:hypothetical protein CFter6_0536 [Collimonas fungivorans]|uniref:Uncharacterized protein n=1 Tax=Collimonas fungivorans TaxID=158899 RepID=A0A127P6J4_9BURK|nr:hypothetical protein CFter6_0536 [Collimonas fungivorans]